MIELNVRQLGKSFGPRQVFSGLSFEFGKGVLGIAGPNGSGKSTLLKCLGNLLLPTRGTIQWLEGGRVLEGQHFQQKLGYAAPYINLYDELSCRENLSFLAKVRHINGGLSIGRRLEEVQLSHVADRLFGKLSTGQQQRLRLASALFHGPDILMLDEPGSNLDDEGQKLIAGIVEQFRSPGKMLIIASNNQHELDLCGRIFSVEEQQFL